MGHLFSHHRWLPSNGLNQTFTRARISPQDLCPEGLQIRYHMRLVSCPVRRIRLTRRVSIPFLEALTATHSIQRHNLLSPEMAASHFHNRCRTMALRITALRITGRHISLIMPSLHHNSSTITEWGITWLDRVQTTLCHLIMHLHIWVTGQ
jgi:hypothetical protein